MMSQQEYESRELRLLAADLAQVENEAIRYRLEAKQDLLEDLEEVGIGLIIERAGWVADGSYGYGAYLKCKNGLLSVKDLWRLTLALEWKVSRGYAAQIWGRLSKAEKEGIETRFAQILRGARD